MTFQNRVTPFGNIIAQDCRGLFTGNRGIIHDPETRTLHPARRWTSKAWIICLCAFKGRRRDVFGRNGKKGGAGWTELFFLDEATALAAGHRPCFYCQPDRARCFQDAFSKGQAAVKLSAPDIDSILHSERLNKKEKRLHPLLPQWRSFPDGTMFSAGNAPYILLDGLLLRWHPAGYENVETMPEYLITPPSIVAAMQYGYQPVLHDSARSR